MRRKLRSVMLLVLALVLGVQSALAEWVWWEAESTQDTNFRASSANTFGPANEQEAAVLSGGKWIGVDAKGMEGAYAEYDVEVPADGQYHFYARKFWKHGPFRWRFDEQPWQEVTRDVVLRDSETIRPLLGANWVMAGKATLPAGKRKLRIELTDPNSIAQFDCFVLSTEPFVPRGKLKPGEKYNRAPDGWFAFEPDADKFGESAIDLRRLNEPFAGSKGSLTRRGENLVFANEGKPVRFWGVTIGTEACAMDRSAIDYMARNLAKHGVNMVRFHLGPAFDTETAKTRLDGVQYMVAALKKQGIYSLLSIYCLAGAENKPSWNIPELGEGGRPFSALYFYPKMQALYRQWWRNVLATANPYTGLTLAEDPAVAVVELVDEDNYFFWTFRPYQSIPAPLMNVLEEQFAAWLVAKYGSLERAQKDWGEFAVVKGDDFANGRVGLYSAGELTSFDWAVASANRQRAADQREFLTQSLRAFWADTSKWLKEDLGYQGLVLPTNWQTADERLLGPLDKYTYTAGDIVARNSYYGPEGHKGERAGYSISQGDLYRDRAAVRNPTLSMPSEIQMAGYPYFVTETGWVMPNRFMAEGAMLFAAYGVLQGVDGLFPFVMDEPTWSTTDSRKWPITVPTVMGQFPGTALLYRGGYLREGPEVVRDALKLRDLYDGKPAAAADLRAIDDPVRAQQVQEQTQPGAGAKAWDALALRVGKATIAVGDGPGESSMTDISAHVDRNARQVNSATRELKWDYGSGCVMVDASCAQGATGFLQSNGTIELADVTISSDNEFASVLLVSLDGKPLQESDRMLLQVMTEEKNYGWTTSLVKDDKGVEWKKIESLGSAPVVVREFAGNVTLKRPDAAALKITALDFNGYPEKQLPGGPTIRLEPRTMYYLLEK